MRAISGRQGWFTLLALSVATVEAPGGTRASGVDFNRDVRPILSETCYQCHGPDQGKRKASLRLDTKEGVLGKGEGGPVVVAGKPEESELLTRLTSDDPEEKMPPPGSGKSLSNPQVEILRRWVAEGAEWKGHWAYIPPERPRPPEPNSLPTPAGFVRDDVDRFVLARLGGKGLTPSPEAGRVLLIRRLSFDLLGLPPTPAEVDAFVNDPSPDAYSALVDRFLASPHFGERMAAWWLDLVRYADTTGYHGDNHRDVTLYRDYVIDAFNRNLPFDRFTTEQIAGDLLPGAGDSARIASGYNKLLQTTQEGGAQAKEYLAKYAADRVRNASTVWLGATLGCAECHDHKFDPFTTRDFYRFASFFADIQDVAVGAQPPSRIPTPDQAARAGTLDAEIAALRKTLDTSTPDLIAAQAAWEQAPGARSVDWDILAPLAGKAVSNGGATLTVRDDGSLIASGKNPERDVYTLSFKAPRAGLTAMRLEVMPDANLPGRGPGRAAIGNFVLNEFEVKEGARALAWSGVTASHSQAGYPVAGSADGTLDTGWAILPEAGRANVAVYEATKDFGGDELTVTLRFHHGESHSLGRFRLSTTAAPRPVPAEGLPGSVAGALDKPPGERTVGQKLLLSSHYRSIAPLLEPIRARLAVVKQARADLDSAMPTTLVTMSGPPRTMHILPRGNWLDETGPVVTPAVPAFLKGSTAIVDSQRATRLDLARWIVSPENPLTARVFVNRLWARFFGQGVVATLDDFGSQGALPTHPELLDALAVDFASSGWDVKRIVRRIVTTGTYRQRSDAPESIRQHDPYNHWLARQGRFRLDAEEVRDNALAVSGLLADQVGGPSARPYQPAGYWSHLNFPKREYQSDHGPGLYRRGLYTYWCRTFLHPSLLAFDAPTREECTVQRPRSNTPLQALVLLNDPVYVESARALAERTLREEGDSTASRVSFIYRTVLSRPPRPAELSVVVGLFDKHLSQYRADVASASTLIRTGERPVPADLDPAALAAWTSVARVVLNLHETITRN